MCNQLLSEKEQMAKKIQEQEHKLNALNSKQEEVKKDSISTHTNERNIKGKIQTRTLNKKKIIETDSNSHDKLNIIGKEEKKMFVGMDNITNVDRKGSLKSLENNQKVNGGTHLAEIKCKNKSMCTPIKNDEMKMRPNIPKSASRLRPELEQTPKSVFREQSNTSVKKIHKSASGDIRTVNITPKQDKNDLFK